MIGEAIRNFSFRVLGPDSIVPADRRYRLQRPNGSTAILLETAESRLEALVIDFGSADSELKSLLGPLLGIRKMSRVGIGAVIQQAVAQMLPEHLFVNVGVWNGFTLLCGMAGNDDKQCVGVDNFSEFGGPREAFLTEFFARRAVSHRFFDSDYRDFFARGVDAPIGVYLYDGEHSYRNQYNGLMTADPFFVEGSVVIVDDTNLARARDATHQFTVDSRWHWNSVLDVRTAANQHVTLWNGLMILEARSEATPSVTWPLAAPIESELTEAGTPDSCALTVVNMTPEAVAPEYTAGSVEIVAVSSSADLAKAIDSSSGAFLFFVQSDEPVQWAAIARAAENTYAELTRD